MRSYLRVIAVAMLLLLGMAQPLSAHPLGNFTINHLSQLAVSGSRVDVVYVLDMAEIPTYQAMRETSPAGTMNHRQLAAWAQTTAATLLAQMHLVVAALPQRLRLDTARARTRRGAGGLPTLYLVIAAHAVLPATTISRSIAYRDETFPNRLGWRDVVLAPASEPTHELTGYPSASIASPRATTMVTLIQSPGGRAIVQTQSGLDTNAPNTTVSALRSNALSDMLARGTGDWISVLLTFFVAIMLGALHALEPGHGKTLLAVSLVGARATMKQAALLAAALTLTHTAGVLALGIAINVFKGYFIPEAIYPWISLASGVVIAIIGARALQRQLRARHAHGHAHGDGVHAHSHATAASAPLTLGGAMWAALSGGVAPCPAALVVLLAAVALNAVVYGICVVIAFSIGLAVTLTGLGIAVVRGALFLQSRPRFERFISVGPALSAIVMATIGAITVGQGLVQSGMASAPIGATVIVAIAIAGYAFSHPSAHRHPGAA